MKAVVIDDELGKILPVLERYVQLYTPDLKIIDAADNINKGYELILEKKPDLVFLDVEIGLDTGFDLLKKFPTINFIVIFISGHEQYAIRAFRLGALDFLHKPIDSEEFKNAVLKAYQQKISPPYQEQIDFIIKLYDQLKKNERPNRLGIPDLDGILFIEIDKIVHIDADGINSNFYIKGQPKKVVSSKNIGSYWDHFAEYSEFMRPHRSHIVNLNEVRRYRRGDRVVCMSNDKEIPVSPKHRDELLNRLSKL